MTSLLDLFRKQPTTPAKLIISEPTLIHTDMYNIYTQEDEKDILPPRPNPPPHNRLLVLTYTTTTVISLTAIILFSIAIPLWNKNFIHRQSPIQTDWPDTLILVPLILSLSSSTYLLVTSVLHRRRYHHHRHHRSQTSGPFNLILLSSTILLSLTPSLILVANNTLANAFSTLNAKSSTSLTPNPKFTNKSQVCNLSNIFTRPCLPVVYVIGELQVGGIILSSILGLAWSVILISSSLVFMNRRVEERRRQEEKKKRKHARRRGHERKHRDGHERSKRDDGHGSSRNHSTDSTEDFRRAQSDYPHPSGRSRSKATSPATLEGSNAVRYVQQKVRPKESIQTWLADRRL